MLSTGHVRYINIQHGSKAFSLFCTSIPKIHLDTKELPSNIEVCPEGLGAMLEYWYIERFLLKDQEDVKSINADHGCSHTELRIVGNSIKLGYLTSQIAAISSTKLYNSFVALSRKKLGLLYKYNWSFQKLLTSTK